MKMIEMEYLDGNRLTDLIAALRAATQSYGASENALVRDVSRRLNGTEGENSRQKARVLITSSYHEVGRTG